MSATTMTKAEARELKALVRSEYKVLGEEVKRRTQELLEECDEWFDQKQRDLDEALAPYKKRMATAEAAFQKKVDAIENTMKADGLTLDKRYGDRWAGAHSVGWSRWTSEGVGKASYEGARTAIYRQSRLVERTLDRDEQNMIRDLTLTTLSSEEALAFFHDIPTVEDLLPAPAEMSALNGG